MSQSPPPSAVGCYQCDLSLQLHVPPSHHLKRLSKHSSPVYVTACGMRNFDLSNLKKKCFLSLLSSMYVTKPRSALGWASGPCLARTGFTPRCSKNSLRHCSEENHLETALPKTHFLAFRLDRNIDTLTRSQGAPLHDILRCIMMHLCNLIARKSQNPTYGGKNRRRPRPSWEFTRESPEVQPSCENNLARIVMAKCAASQAKSCRDAVIPIRQSHKNSTSEH